MIKIIYRKLKTHLQRILFLFSINWIKTLYINFKMLPYYQAKKLPIIIYGRVKISALSGSITINSNINTGMIGLGQKYENIKVSSRIAQLCIEGDVIFNGYAQFGLDYFLYIGPKSKLEMGNMSSLGLRGKIFCSNSIKLGEFARVGYESQIIDSSFHEMKDLSTKQVYPISSPIEIGNYNYIGGRVTIMKSTKTANYTTIASNSLLTKDYSQFGENCMFGGFPSKLLRTNISRDWEKEKENLTNYIKVKI